MAAFDDISPITLPRNEDERKRWGWEPHEQVVIRGVYTAADAEAVGNSSASTGKDGVVFQLGTARIKLMERLIQSWTFTRNGLPVPVSLDAIRRLPGTYQTPILDVCDSLSQVMPAQEQEDFLPSASEHIVDGFASVK